MTLVKTSLLNGIAVIVKMLTLLGINKVLAIYVGPAGYAAIGQFQNAVQMITTFGSGAINTGVTKYTAEYHDKEEQQHLVWRTAGTIALIGSLTTSILIALFNKSLAVWFLKDASYGGVFLWFAATLVLFVFNTLLLAILNGKKEIARYVVANIAGSIFALVVTTFASIEFGLYGALVALAIYQSISFFVTLIICCRASWFHISYVVGGIDSQAARNLAKFIAMALTSASCVPISHIVVRNHLGYEFGLDAAGYWEAMWRLSAAYLMLVSSTLSVYYLPRLAELKNSQHIKSEIINVYKLILPIAALSGIVIYILRDFLILILFTNNFSPMRDLFAWQMIGDTLKIASWILAYVMLGKAMFKIYIVSEIFFSALFIFSTFGFTHFYGFEGVAISHAFTYGIYWIFTYCFIWRKLNF